MENIRVTKLAGMFLLTVIAAFLLPTGKAYAVLSGSVDASTLRVGDDLREGDLLYSPDASDPYSFLYYQPGTLIHTKEPILGSPSYTVIKIYDTTDWTVTSINGKLISLNKPQGRNVAELPVDGGTDTLTAGEELYRPDNAAWTVSYYTIDATTVLPTQMEEPLIPGYKIKTINGRTEWTYTVNKNTRRVDLGRPFAPPGRSIERLKTGDLLHTRDLIYTENDYVPWSLIYRNPDDHTDVITDTFAGYYAVKNAFGRDEWTVSQRDSTARSVTVDSGETPGTTPDPGPSPDPGGHDTPAGDDSSHGEHEHHFEWVVVKEPTEYEDGLMRYRCEGCKTTNDGQGVSVSAYGVFCRKTADGIGKAEAGGTVTVDAKQWISFPKAVMEALKARTDVTLTVTFRDKGKNYSFTIPAGGMALLTEEADYYGFYYLGEIFGLEQK